MRPLADGSNQVAGHCLEGLVGEHALGYLDAGRAQDRVAPARDPAVGIAGRADDTRENPKGIRESRNLALMTKIADDDAKRIAFDGGEAMSRIARDGFYAFAVTIQVREGVE